MRPKTITVILSVLLVSISSLGFWFSYKRGVRVGKNITETAYLLDLLPHLRKQVLIALQVEASGSSSELAKRLSDNVCQSNTMLLSAMKFKLEADSDLNRVFWATVENDEVVEHFRLIFNDVNRFENELRKKDLNGGGD